MISMHSMVRWLLAAGRVVVIAGLVAATSAQAAAPANWKDTGFSVDTEGARLRDVLRDFGRVYGVTVSTSVNDSVRMKGRFKAETGTDFLERLGQAYNFNWFVNNGTLYIVSRVDNISMRLQLGEDAVQDAKAALVGLGLLDTRFGWGELPDEGIVIVSGPRRYVELAREFLLPDEAKAAQKEKEFMLFRLKYASAKDRTISTRGKTEVIPGVKTILTSLLLGSPAAPRTNDEESELQLNSTSRSRKPTVQPGGHREVARYGTGTNAGGPDRQVETAGRGSDKDRLGKSKSTSDDSRPRIEANPALNAILIYDKRSTRESYQALIDQLDVEPQQVEIEALIVDIDRSKLTDLGIEWGFTSGDTTTTINGTRAEGRGINLPVPGATLLISNVARFYARLKALEGAGEAQILATPTVLTLDNVAAVLDLSQTAYLPLTGERVAELADVTAGTMLRVTPRIIGVGDGAQVHMEVDIEDGSLDSTGGNVNAKRSTISTQAIVDLQQTLMIGGYHSDSVTKDQQQTPVLGDIPVFGNLFKTKSDSHRSRERLFMITPRLVLGTAARVAASAAAATGSTNATQAAVHASATSAKAATGRESAQIHIALKTEAPAVDSGHRALQEVSDKLRTASDLSTIDLSSTGKTVGQEPVPARVPPVTAATAKTVVPSSLNDSSSNKLSPNDSSPARTPQLTAAAPTDAPAKESTSVMAQFSARVIPAASAESKPPASSVEAEAAPKQASVEQSGSVLAKPTKSKYGCAKPKTSLVLPT